MFHKGQHFNQESILTSKSGRKTRIGSFYCFLNGQTYTTMRGISNALRPLGYSSKKFYDDFYKESGEGVCKYDSNFPTRFGNFLDGYLDTCGKCPTCVGIKKKKMSFSAKRPETISRKLNAIKKANSTRSKEEQHRISEKRKKTLLERYGPTYLSDRAKDQWEKLSKEEKNFISSKIKATKLKNGSHTNGTHFKECGRKIVLGDNLYCIQGYEDVVVKELFHKGVEFFLGKDVPRIPYSLNTTGKSRPDIFLPKYNFLLEVKSDWTLHLGINKCMEIGKNALDLGFNYAVFAIKEIIKSPERSLCSSDIQQLSKFINMLTSSQYLNITDKVQRLELDGSYRPIVFGSGSARVPMDKFTSLEYDIVYSTLKDVAA